ncbi:ClpXP protease specificity-enhancing factor [Marinospirillum sp. MEB164]|uniref:ClpXP protease specificity-enhancing factor n=1 Tax=Marinospirillum alkalitolerans TaxID=3123374 RepID=A0ABW8PXC3_9GAMM
MSLSSRPYLLRALYEWLLDNELTPYILVAADVPGVRVPQHLVKDGQITLNIAPSAVRDLLMDMEWVTFSARFNGQPMQVDLPIDAVLAIFARENGAGMAFGAEPVLAALKGQAQSAPEQQEAKQEVKEESKASSAKVSHLTVIK